jgi:hypothetical protein
MEAILKFNLPEEQNEFEQSVNGMDWGLAMWDLDNALRDAIKYDHRDGENGKPLDQDALSYAREKIIKVMSFYGLEYPM